MGLGKGSENNPKGLFLSKLYSCQGWGGTVWVAPQCDLDLRASQGGEFDDLLQPIPTPFVHFWYAGEDGQKVLLVTLPDFSTTQTACLINLRDLTCQPVSFSAFGANDEEEEGAMETGP